MVDKYIKSNICPLPWTSLEVSVNGSVKPCCLYKEEISDKKRLNPYQLYKVYKSSTLTDIQNSEYMQELRKEFVSGSKPKGCRSCWAEEDAGKTSKRMNSLYKMRSSLKDWTPNSKPSLKFIDFKLGNVCNLKCRICGSWSSSKWAQEELSYNKDNDLARLHLNEGGWPKRYPEFFENVKKVLKDVEYFEFTGGEPFMIQQHFELLKYCIKEGYAKNQDIHYNTNGTHLPGPEIFEMWKHFKRVEIAFSIDDIGEQFEYQRHPAKWIEVNENMYKFKQQRTDNMQFQICTTISMFNVLNLAKIALWVKQFNPEFFYVNTCFDPPCYNVQTLPKRVKSIVTARYYNIKEFKPTIRYMNLFDGANVEIDKERKVRIIKADVYRKEKFSDTFPILNNLLKIYE